MESESTNVPRMWRPYVNRSGLKLVSLASGDLPAASKYHFFVSTGTSLGEIPHQGPERGRMAEVLPAAGGFAFPCFGSILANNWRYYRRYAHGSNEFTKSSRLSEARGHLTPF